MALNIRFHRILAFAVLIAAGAWVGTGEFAFVGSEAAHAEAKAAEAATPTPAPEGAAADKPLRTVGATAPVFIDHARGIRLSAVTDADKRTELAARTSGIISELHVEKGGQVAAGELVMALEGPDMAAAVETARAALDKAQQELDVAVKLHAGGNLTDLQLTAARAAKAAAESQLSQARADAENLRLTAPFAGIVDSVSVERGEWVQPGAPVATILSLDPIVVRGEVGELDVAEVLPGARAKVRLVDGTQIEGTVRHVAREASGATRTFPIEVALPNPDHAIPAGMTAEVTLYAAPVRAVSVPRSVITLSTEGDIGLRVVDADGIVSFVRVGIIDDTTEGLIVTGVPEDCRIIVAGQDMVVDGEKVAVTEAPAAGAAGTAP